MAEAKVQNDIQERIQGYPDKAESSVHNAHCYIPAALAAVLDHSPNLVAPIVHAFYYRDPVDLKCCITFRHFRPGTRVMHSVKFTRCLYAQLLQQKFKPDQRSGYTIPAPSNPKYKAYDLGLKLAHGAEILCSKCDTTDDDDDDPLKTVTCDPRWNRYLATLNAKGYFKGELEGSRLYRKLLDDAKRHFVMTLGVTNSQVNSANPSVQILKVLKHIDYDIEEMRKEEKSLPPDEDDSWLNISPDQLDAMLERASGKKVASPKVSDLNEVTRGMKEFISEVSSYEGAEVPGSEDSEVQFDPNSFMQTMQKVFDFDSDEASSSDLSEYGSEDDLDDYSFKPKRTNSQSGSPTKPKTTSPDGIEDFLGMKDYMEAMDRELARTSLGQSFEKKQSNPVPPPRRKKKARTGSQASSGSSDATPSSQRNQSRRSNTMENRDDAVDIDDIDEDFQPVDIDMNVVKNLMESYSSQVGMPGPTSNILGSMGIRLSQDARPDEFC